MSQVINGTTDNFESEVLKSELPVLVDFYADWCGPCRMIAPVVEELAEEYAGEVKFAKVDVDTEGQIARDFGIRSIPALLIYRNGEVLETIVGPKPDFLRDRVAAVAALASASA